MQDDFESNLIEHYRNFDQLDFRRFREVEIFIFFSFSPTFPLLKIYKKIKESNKKIILIQDNHQFSVHKGSVNSIILRPDLVITASDSERKYLIENLGLRNNCISSQGWLFQNNKSISNEKPISLNKKILIAFAAPPSITPLSEETYLLRKEIILWVTKNFPTCNLLIKLHPHEDQGSFRKFIKRYTLNHILLSSQSPIKEAISGSEIVICSNESQIALDVISTDISKRLIIYRFKKNNFLSNEISAEPKSLFKNSDFEISELGIQEKNNIAENYLSLDHSAEDIIKDRLDKLYLQENNMHANVDIFLWLFIYGKNNDLINFLQSNKSDNYRNLHNLILNKSFNLEQLNDDFQDTWIRDPLCIILIRHYLHKKVIDKASVEIITKDFFSIYIFQFFFRDFIRFYNLINAKGLLRLFDKKYHNLVNKIEDLYINKFRPFRIFFSVLKIIYSLKIKILSAFIFRLSDAILRFK